ELVDRLALARRGLEPGAGRLDVAFLEGDAALRDGDLALDALHVRLADREVGRGEAALDLRRAGVLEAGPRGARRAAQPRRLTKLTGEIAHCRELCMLTHRTQRLELEGESTLRHGDGLVIGRAQARLSTKDPLRAADNGAWLSSNHLSRSPTRKSCGSSTGGTP